MHDSDVIAIGKQNIETASIFSTGMCELELGKFTTSGGNDTEASNLENQRERT